MSVNTAKAIALSNVMMTRFDDAHASYEPVYPKISMVRPSTKRSEDYAWLGAVPGMREWLGDRRFEQLRAATFAVENKPFESSIAVDKDDIEDDNVGMYADLAAIQGEECAKHPDELVLDCIVNGNTLPVYDGQYFFDTDHSFGDSGTQSPTAVEFKAAVEYGIRTILGFKNDQGKHFHRGIIKRVNGIALLVPLNMREAAYGAFESIIISNSSNVIIDKPEIYPVPSLTDDDVFYVLWTWGIVKPIVYQIRRPLQRSVEGYQTREFKELKFMADYRGAAYPVAWWKAARITLT
jgi:phage major head subunit gpT-like protein